ncbi:isochorismate synthase [Kurthia gibsonii]|uniref:isochorismate synthase n=1 Tax=Kurthia gibsonii TaxID=33946 RepID=UPI0030D2006C
MNRKLSTINGDLSKTDQSTVHFYIESKELETQSTLVFFEIGEEKFKGQCFYWQNKDKDFTLVGLGHAYTIKSNDADARYEDVEKAWKHLIHSTSLKGIKQQPILFGSFTFDPKKGVSDEWANFSHANFALAKHQLVESNGRFYMNTHLVSEEVITDEDIELAREEREALLEQAKGRTLKTYIKPHVVLTEEPYKEEYLQSITQVTNQIKAKQADKVVIARSLALTFDEEVNTSNLLAQLSEEQPESYLFAQEQGQDLFLGATPERLVFVNHKKAYSSCVAGSIRRGATVQEDEEFGRILLNDTKNLQEHQYVVDMISNSFKETCEQYTLPNYPDLLKIRDIQHLHTPIEGILKEDATILQMVEKLHPTPALGGSPREVAMEMIRQYEPMNRGVYAAPIGWLNADGDGEFAVAIRSALLQDKKAYLYAGGGIVADSEPQSEYEETLVKFRPMLRTLGGKLNDE